MNRKSSIPMGINRRKSGSLGFKQYMMGGGSQDTNEMPSVSRPRPSTSFMQNMSIRQSLMPPEFAPPSSRSSRYTGQTGQRRKRSSSQEPAPLERRRTFAASPMDHHHHPAAGLLLTPVRPTPSRSPGLNSLASSNRSATSRRHSSKLHIIPDSSQKIKDPRTLGDKNFQNIAYSRIHNFLRGSVKIKPLSNSGFVQAFNAIYKELDPSTQVTNSDYAEKISKIIKNLCYPSNISKTSFVAVNSGHAISQVLGLLSWLVDCVEVLMTINAEALAFPNSEVDPETKLEKSLSKTIMQLYANYKGQGDAVQYQESVDEFFMTNMGISSDEQDQLEFAIEAFEKEIKTLEDDPRKAEDDEKVTQLTLAEDRINDVKQDIESHIVQSGSLKAKINTEKEHIRTIESDNARYMDMCAELSDRIERQPMKHSDRDRMIEKSKQINSEIKHYQEHLEMVHKYIGAADVKICKLHNDIRTVIHDINGIVLEHQLNEQYKWTHNPTHANAKEHLTRALNFWTRAVESMEQTVELDDRLYSKIQKDIDEFQEIGQQKKEEVLSIVNECALLDSKINDDQGNCRMKEHELNEKLSEARKKCLALAKELESMPKLEELNAMIANINENIKKHKAEFIERRKFLEEYFFPRLHKVHQNFAEELYDKVDKIYGAITCKKESS